MENDTRKYMDLKEFREAGFLQEANRVFFHPLGVTLQMVWPKSEDETKVEVFSTNGQWEVISTSVDGSLVCHYTWNGLNAEKRAKEYAATLNKPYIEAILDYRDDPEGMIFSLEENELEDFKQKMEFIRQLRRDHLNARLLMQNYTITTEQIEGVQIV